MTECKAKWHDGIASEFSSMLSNLHDATGTWSIKEEATTQLNGCQKKLLEVDVSGQAVFCPKTALSTAIFHSDLSWSEKYEHSVVKTDKSCAQI
jgi:hypothetical protein